MTELDVERLRDLAAGDSTRRVLEIIKSRQRGRVETSIEKVEEWVTEVDPDANGRRQAIVLLRELEKANAGRIILGRGGNKTRFHWYFDMREVAGRALESAAPGELVAPKPPATDAPMKRFVFPLRRDQDLIIEVPVDMTADERDRLADFIRILPV